MKAVCMTHKNFSNIPIDPSIPRPAIGEEVTIVGSRVYAGEIDCFLLKEYTSPSSIFDWLYDKRNFSLLSDIDEMELVNENFISCFS